MHFDTFIPAIMLLLGFVAQWYRMESKVAEHEKRIAELKGEIKEAAMTAAGKVSEKIKQLDEKLDGKAAELAQETAANRREIHDGQTVIAVKLDNVREDVGKVRERVVALETNVKALEATVQGNSTAMDRLREAVFELPRKDIRRK